MNRFLVALCLVLVAVGQPRTFKVGDTVESEYAGGWTAGVVTEVLAGANKGWYKIRYESGKEFAADGARMRLKGKSLSAPATVDPKDTFGAWTLSTVAATTRTDGSNTYRDRTLYAQGDLLTVNADGSFAWKMGGETIRGRWTREANPSQDRGPVILEKGFQGMRWWVGYNGKSQTGQDNVYIRSEAGTRYWGWKVN